MGAVNFVIEWYYFTKKKCLLKKILERYSEKVSMIFAFGLKYPKDMEQLTCSKLGKEYNKAIYRHSAYLTSMQSTSCEMLSWVNHKLE